jgi:hypothetical protein
VTDAWGSWESQRPLLVHAAWTSFTLTPYVQYYQWMNPRRYVLHAIIIVSLGAVVIASLFWWVSREAGMRRTSFVLEDSTRISFSSPRAWGSVTMTPIAQHTRDTTEQTPKRLDMVFSRLPFPQDCPGLARISVIKSVDMHPPVFQADLDTVREIREIISSHEPLNALLTDTGPDISPRYATLRWPSAASRIEMNDGHVSSAVRYLAVPVQGIEPGIEYVAILLSRAGDYVLKVEVSLDCGLVRPLSDKLYSSTGDLLLTISEFQTLMRNALEVAPRHPQLGPLIRQLDKLVASTTFARE